MPAARAGAAGRRRDEVGERLRQPALRLVPITPMLQDWSLVRLLRLLLLMLTT
jgi:hypothetical protein